MNAQQVEHYRRRLNSRLPLLGGWLRRRAVQELARDASPEALYALAASAARARSEAARTAALDALTALAAGGHRGAQESLCGLVMDYDLPRVRELVLKADYLPRQELQRALFFFLTGQWDRYEALDFDHRLLRLGYETADQRLKARLRARARQAGRLEWVDAVAGTQQARRLGGLTDRDWKAAITVLEDNRRWEEMWRLAQEAPARWSARLLRSLHAAGWRPGPADREAFTELTHLATAWEGDDFRAAMHCRTILKGHQDAIRCLGLCPGGRFLVTGSEDRSLRLWIVPEGKELATLKGHRGTVTCLAVSPNGRLVASGSRDGTARLWSLPAAGAIGAAPRRWARRAVKLKGHDQTVTCLALSPDGTVLATGSADSTIQLWGVPGGASLATLTGHDLGVLCLAFNPDGTVLATGSADCTVRLWSLPRGRPLRTLTGHRCEQNDAVLCLAASPDGRYVASGGTDGSVRLWSLPGGQALQTWTDHKGGAASLAFTPDGSLLASGAGDHTIRLRRLSDGQTLNVLEGHASEVTCVVVSPDGGMLASASGGGYCLDRTVRLWSLPDGRLLKVLDGHSRYVTCLAMTPDGQFLASGSGDRTVRLWTSELGQLSGRPVRDTTLNDLARVQELLEKNGLADEERAGLAFVAALLRRHRRADIVVEAAAPQRIEIGEFDIEIEG